jgi:hypothetical protein
LDSIASCFTTTAFFYKGGEFGVRRNRPSLATPDVDDSSTPAFYFDTYDEGLSAQRRPLIHHDPSSITMRPESVRGIGRFWDAPNGTIASVNGERNSYGLRSCRGAARGVIILRLRWGSQYNAYQFVCCRTTSVEHPNGGLGGRKSERRANSNLNGTVRLHFWQRKRLHSMHNVLPGHRRSTSTTRQAKRLWPMRQ